MVAARSGDDAELGLDGECLAAVARWTGAGRSHSEVERKRRERINAHLDTLRGLVPSASRMDKAALLGEVVRYVRELRSEAGGATAGSAVAVPGEGDEVIVEEVEVEGCSCDAGERQARRVKAWVCCADRPGLMSELGDAARSVCARAVRAEIATVGGRTRSVLELDVARTAAAGGGNGASLPALQAALRPVIMSPEELLAVESYKRRRFSAHFA